MLSMLVIFLTLLLVEGFFAAGEISLISVHPWRLKVRAEKGQRGASQALKLLKTPEYFVATCLLGANLAEISNTVLVTTFFLGFFGPSGEWLAMLLLPPLILMFAEIIPKSIARQRPNQLAPALAPLLWASSLIIYPLTMIFAGVSHAVLFLTGVHRSSRVPFITREDLHLVVRESGPEVDLETSERKIIHRILQFSARTVKEAMVPLIQVAAVPDTSMVSQVLEEFRATRYSRLPVYHRRIDNIVGMVASFDLLGESAASRPIKDFLRPVHYVSEIKKIDRLLAEMQQLGIHLAVVVDEYGGAVGIVTIEDLLEEVVGEIADEFDQEVTPCKKLGDRHYLINGRMEIGAINEQLNLDLPAGDYETLGGFLIAQAGDIPKPGEQVRYGRLRFVVRQAEPRVVKEVELFVEDHHA